MRVAVTSTGPDLDAEVDPRFGRCQYFLIIELDDMSFEALENPSIALGGGAGIQSAQLMSEKEAKVVLTGNCGPNAYATLSSAGIEVIIGAGGVVRQVVEQYKSGQLSPTGGANVQSHFGMGTGGSGMQAGTQGPMPGAGIGGGGGMGMGGGMGRGRGMGRGGGMGMGAGMMGAPAGGLMAGPSPQMTKEQEMEMLKVQAQTMQQQTEQILARIKELEKSEGK